eukprot:gene18005-biopygen1745
MDFWASRVKNPSGPAGAPGRLAPGADGFSFHEKSIIFIFGAGPRALGSTIKVAIGASSSGGKAGDEDCAGGRPWRNNGAGGKDGSRGIVWRQRLLWQYRFAAKMALASEVWRHGGKAGSSA